MYVKYTPNNTKKYNSNSSKKTFEYLTKEDELEINTYNFFNNENDNISKNEAINLIDSNCSHNKKSLSNFYMITVSPSKEELLHIDKLANEISKEIDSSNLSEKEKFDLSKEFLLREYTNNIMKEYASNFNKDVKHEELVYVARIEKTRKHNEQDSYVKSNLKIDKLIKNNPKDKELLELKYKRDNNNQIIRAGMDKTGDNSHIHIIVSRYDNNPNKRLKRSLSPMSKGIESKGLHNSKIGFSRNNFNQKVETTFDKTFNYDRQKHELYKSRKEFVKENSFKKNNSNIIDKINYESKTLVKNQIEDTFKNSKLIDKNIPLSIQDLKFKVQNKIMNDTNLNQYIISQHQIKKQLGIMNVRDLMNKTDKGVDLGY